MDLRAGKTNLHLLISPRRSEASRSNFLMGSIGDANEFLLAVFTTESIGLAVPTPLCATPHPDARA